MLSNEYKNKIYKNIYDFTVNSEYLNAPKIY